MNIAKECRKWLESLLRVIPGSIGETLRVKFGGFKCGSGCRIVQNVIIYHPKQLTIGDNSAIAANCQLNAGGGISIGSNVLIGPCSLIWSQNHKFSNPSIPIRLQGYERQQVVIEDDVWIAANCVILPGVKIATGCVIAAGAVLTKSTTPYSIWAGVPAKQIGQRLPNQPDGNEPAQQ